MSPKRKSSRRVSTRRKRRLSNQRKRRVSAQRLMRGGGCTYNSYVSIIAPTVAEKKRIVKFIKSHPQTKYPRLHSVAYGDLGDAPVYFQMKGQKVDPELVLKSPLEFRTWSDCYGVFSDVLVKETQMDLMKHNRIKLLLATKAISKKRAAELEDQPSSLDEALKGQGFQYDLVELAMASNPGAFHFALVHNGKIISREGSWNEPISEKETQNLLTKYKKMWQDLISKVIKKV